MMRNVNDQESGSFTYTNPYFQFEGTTLGGKPHGFGTLLMGDGTSLSGVFTNGDLTGEGCKRWEDGSFYVGGFVKGEMHGVGRWVRIADGTDYRGEVAKGAKHGHGKQYNMRTRSLYEGPFHHGKYHGLGTILQFPVSTPIDVELSPHEVREAAVHADAALHEGEGHGADNSDGNDANVTVIIRGIPMVVEVPPALDASTNSLGLGLGIGGRSRASIVFPPGASLSSLPGGGSSLHHNESHASLPVGFLPPSIVTLALRRIRSIKANEALGKPPSPDKTSPETSAARNREGSMPGALHGEGGSGKMTVIHGPFSNGLLHGDGVTARFANGDVFEGSAVGGELEGHDCEFLALCGGGSVPLQYHGPMKASRRAEVPTDIIVQDIYHESCGSIIQQYHECVGGGGGSSTGTTAAAASAGGVGVNCTTSVLLVLQQVIRRQVTEQVPVLRNRAKSIAASTTKMAASMAASKRVAESEPTETVTKDVFVPCTGESGRPVRAQLFKLSQALTATQLKALKRPPRDATKALFATEPLTPRPDDSRGGSQSGSLAGSPRTPNGVGERATARSPSDGRRTEEGDSLTPSSSKLGKTPKTQSSRSMQSGGNKLIHFPLDSGKAQLQMTMQNGVVTMKLAPLCREAGEYLVKLEVFHGGGFPTWPGVGGGDVPEGPSADVGMAPMPQNTFWVPLHVIR